MLFHSPRHYLKLDLSEAHDSFLVVSTKPCPEKKKNNMHECVLHSIGCVWQTRSPVLSTPTWRGMVFNTYIAFKTTLSGMSPDFASQDK
uniref:Uncharacterized protein n=1 Tax=Timema poppense TaxID=170557 RepID=A0A7R9DL35_TIMPO|nr:unnamed protein product [Timema poppensis]